MLAYYRFLILLLYHLQLHYPPAHTCVCVCVLYGLCMNVKHKCFYCASELGKAHILQRFHEWRYFCKLSVFFCGFTVCVWLTESGCKKEHGWIPVCADNSQGWRKSFICVCLCVRWQRLFPQSTFHRRPQIPPCPFPGFTLYFSFLFHSACLVSSRSPSVSTPTLSIFLCSVLHAAHLD